MRKLFTVILFVVGTATALAQQDFEWEKYGLAFTLADDFKVTANTDESFEASGDGMEFGVYTWENPNLTQEDLGDLIVELAGDIELSIVDDADYIELNQLKGAYVEGYKDGSRIFVMGMMDPDSEANFFALVTYLPMMIV